MGTEIPIAARPAADGYKLGEVAREIGFVGNPVADIAVKYRVHEESEAGDAYPVHEPGLPWRFVPCFRKYMADRSPEILDDCQHAVLVTFTCPRIPERVKRPVAQAVLQHIED